MVVVSVGVIMGIVGYSGFSNMMQREKATAASNQLMGHLKEAKMLAVEKHVSYGIDVTGNVYTVFRDTDSDCTNDGNETIVHQVNVAQAFPGVTLQGDTTFRFDTRGRPRNTSGGFAAVTVTVRYVPPDNPGSYRRQCKLTMSSAGRIHVEPCTDL